MLKESDYEQRRSQVRVLPSAPLFTLQMGTEQAVKYLSCESVKAFEKIAAREEIPKHYLSARAPRYNRAELDAWLMGRRGAYCK